MHSTAAEAEGEVHRRLGSYRPKLHLDVVLMTESNVFTTASASRKEARPKTTGPEVVEISFNSAVFMVSPHPERGNALALTMQGQSMAIQVAMLLVENKKVTEAVWEVPFSGRPPEWQDALLALIHENAGPTLQISSLTNGSGSASPGSSASNTPSSAVAGGGA